MSSKSPFGIDSASSRSRHLIVQKQKQYNEDVVISKLSQDRARRLHEVEDKLNPDNPRARLTRPTLNTASRLNTASTSKFPVDVSNGSYGNSSKNSTLTSKVSVRDLASRLDSGRPNMRHKADATATSMRRSSLMQAQVSYKPGPIHVRLVKELDKRFKTIKAAIGDEDESCLSVFAALSRYEGKNLTMRQLAQKFEQNGIKKEEPTVAAVIPSSISKNAAATKSSNDLTSATDKGIARNYLRNMEILKQFKGTSASPAESLSKPRSLAITPITPITPTTPKTSTSSRVILSPSPAIVSSSSSRQSSAVSSITTKSMLTYGSRAVFDPAKSSSSKSRHIPPPPKSKFIKL